MDPTTAIDWEKVSVAALLGGLVAAFWKGLIIPRFSYDAMCRDKDEAYASMKAERDEFKAIALRGVELSAKALDVARQVKAS